MKFTPDEVQGIPRKITDRQRIEERKKKKEWYTRLLELLKEHEWNEAVEILRRERAKVISDKTLH